MPGFPAFLGTTSKECQIPCQNQTAEVVQMPEPSTKSPKAYQFMFVLYQRASSPQSTTFKLTGLAHGHCMTKIHIPSKNFSTTANTMMQLPRLANRRPQKATLPFVVKFKNARYITGVQKRFASTPKSMMPQSRNATTCTRRMFISGIRTTPTNSSMTRSRLLVCTTSTHLNRTRVSPRKNR